MNYENHKIHGQAREEEKKKSAHHHKQRRCNFLELTKNRDVN